MHKVFISGATGFIGKRLLQSVSHEHIRILSRQPHPEYEPVIFDLQSEEIPDDALDGIDTVFHLAVVAGVKWFVFVSSVKAGVDPPEGVYGQTKREAELKILEIGQQSGVHVSIIRPSLVYGPDVKGNLALMQRGIRQGWFPPLPETGNRRSMIHVDDLVRAILLVAEDKRANGEIFIATDGVEYSSCEIYKTMCQVLDKSVPNWSVPKFLFDLVGKLSSNFKYKVNKLLGDEYYSSEKLQSLGFKAQRSLRDMNETEF